MCEAWIMGRSDVLNRGVSEPFGGDAALETRGRGYSARDLEVSDAV